MFEVGFTEILMILGLALLVLGPEKLPGLAQKVGRWTGRARAMARQLRTQLEQEVTVEEMMKSRPAPKPAQPEEPVTSHTEQHADVSSHSEPTDSYMPGTHLEPEGGVHAAAGFDHDIHHDVHHHDTSVPEPGPEVVQDPPRHLRTAQMHQARSAPAFSTSIGASTPAEPVRSPVAAPVVEAHTVHAAAEPEHSPVPSPAPAKVTP
jgi:sec-independent protein translocase protein TatB